MTFAEVERRMREQGYTWDGEGPNDPDGAFVPADKTRLTMTISQAVEHLTPWSPPTDELRG
jgi:hypothetical protein